MLWIGLSPSFCWFADSLSALVMKVIESCGGPWSRVVLLGYPRPPVVLTGTHQRAATSRQDDVTVERQQEHGALGRKAV